MSSVTWTLFTFCVMEDCKYVLCDLGNKTCLDGCVCVFLYDLLLLPYDK